MEELKKQCEKLLDTLIGRGIITPRSSIMSNPEHIDVWVETADHYTEWIKDVHNPEDILKAVRNTSKGHKIWMCEECSYYINGKCMNNYTGVINDDCLNFSWGDTEPDDELTAKLMNKLVVDDKSAVDLFWKVADNHLKADNILRAILIHKGYKQGIDIFDALSKGYDAPMPDDMDYSLKSFINWQCLLCRKYQYNWYGGCPEGWDEGWEDNNSCRYIELSEMPVSAEDFFDFMNNILVEKDDGEYDDAVIHYNMDKLIAYTLESLGYRKTVEAYKQITRYYVDIPF